MSRLWHPRMMAVFLFLYSVLGGCITDYDPVRVLVTDVSSGEPIKGAHIKINYHQYLLTPLNARVTEVRTDENGRAVVEAAEASWLWIVMKEGYLEVEASTGTELVPQEFVPEPNAMIGAHVRMYRQPRPQVTFVVPNDLRGLIRVDLSPANRHVQGRPGQRQFTYRVDIDGGEHIEATPLLPGYFTDRVDADGYVRIEATRLLLNHWRVWGDDTNFRLANGNELPKGDRDTGAAQLAWFWTSSFSLPSGDGEIITYFLGTPQQYEVWKRQ